MSCQSVFLFCQDKEGGCQWPIDGQIMKGVSQTKDKRDKRIRTKDKDIRVAPIKERKVKVSVAGNGPLIINICHTTDKGIELILMYIYDKQCEIEQKFNEKPQMPYFNDLHWVVGRLVLNTMKTCEILMH